MCLAVGVGSWLKAQESSDTKKPKYTISEVMKEAHGKKLLNKVVGGSASKEEKDKLLDLYISMVENRPGKGEQQAWLMKSGRLIVAAAAVAVGREGAETELKAASNCKSCHDVYK
jgi:hypothetical protein